MENKVKKAIIKKIELYSTILMLATTPIVFTGCSDQIVKEPTKIEISNEEETLSTNEVIENEVSENSVVSENKVVSDNSEELIKNLTDDEIALLGTEIYNLECELKTLNPEDGIYNTRVDFENIDKLYDGRYAKYKECKLDFQEAYNLGIGAYAFISNPEILYTEIVNGDGNSNNSLPICMADVNRISIISQSDTNRYWIITDYQGEEVIEANTKLNMITGRIIEDEINDFSVTTMKDYYERNGTSLSDDGMELGLNASKLDKSLLNTSKVR